MKVTTYARDLVVADLENQSDDATLQKIASDLAKKGISTRQIAEKMEEFYRTAVEQLQAG